MYGFEHVFGDLDAIVQINAFRRSPSALTMSVHVTVEKVKKNNMAQIWLRVTQTDKGLYFRINQASVIFSLDLYTVESFITCSMIVT